MRTLKDLQNLDVEAVAKAIEADAGESILDLRQALVEAKAGKFAASHTPEQIAARSSQARTSSRQCCRRNQSESQSPT